MVRVLANRTLRESLQVVVEVTIVDDGRVEDFGVLHHNLVRLLRDHARRLPVLGVHCRNGERLVLSDV